MRILLVRWRHLAYVTLALALLAGVWSARGRTAAATTPAAVYRGPGDVKAVAFACNVVWGDPYVLPIAEAFRAAGARATFFLGGRWAAAHPAEAQALVRLGMEIGNHGDRHRHVGELSLHANRAEIRRAGEAIRAVTGITPWLYAPAYGEVNGTVLEAAREEGYTVVMWTIDTIDWRPSHSPTVIESRVLRRLVPGAIILIHPTDRTLAALPGLLAAIRREGYRVVSVGELLRGAR